MRYRRNEGFRFSFSKPIPVFFTIEEESHDQTSENEARLMDLSPNGMKINTSLNIPIQNAAQVKVSVRFSLNNTTFQVHGKIIWKKKILDRYFYGIYIYIGKKEQEDMIDNLKVFVKSNPQQHHD